MKARLALLLLAAIAAAWCGWGLAPAMAQPYPRLGLYGSITGNGTPFVDAQRALDPVTLDEVARYDEVILDVNPISPYRPDIAVALRQRHPGIRLLAYVLGHDIWPVADPDSLHHFPTRYRRLVRDLDGFLYNRFNGEEFPGSCVNLARRDAQGRFVVAEGLADLFQDAIVNTGQWDGIFLDIFCYTISWAQDETHQFDYARAGYASLGEFESAWQAGSDTLANRLRRLAGPDYVLAGNCGGSAHQGVMQGWMRENFPYQNGGTWYDNVLSEPHGYFADDRNFLHPTHNYIFSALLGGVGAQYSSENTRRVRFGLGTATLGEGYGVFGPSDRRVLSAPYHEWWYDEYAVNVATAQSAPDLARTGWLGGAAGDAHQMIWAGTNPDASSNAGFETDVTTGWSFGRFAPAVATLTRDGATSALGSASAHIAVTTASGVGWHVNYVTTGTIAPVAGGTCAATFWAKASPERTLTAVAMLPWVGAVATRSVTVDAVWRQYQVILLPSQSGNVALEFFLGTQAGDVWLDDVHFQQGSTSIWRRDFQHGVVLVNPFDQALQVPLGAGWRRIQGLRDPLVNDGSIASTFEVLPNDALFLVSAAPDTIPPDPIRDAHVAP